MKALSLRRRFNNAINTVETNYYYYANKIAIPCTSTIRKSENTGPIRGNVIDTLNIAIHRAHDAVINGITGWSPNPNEKDLASAVYEASSPYLSRLTPLMSQFSKSPLALAGAVALCIGALACNHEVRGEVSNTFDKATQIVADAGNNLTHTIVEAMPKTLPVGIVTAPDYQPVKLSKG